MRSAAETIKDRLGIAEVIGSYIKIEKAGGNYKARCPFHNEKTPSFYISASRNTYYCFGCGVKGDIFTFVQEFEKVDFKGALKILADRAGVELTQFKSADDPLKDEVRKAMEEATKFFQKEIAKSKDAQDYLEKRGLPKNMISEWRIGLAPDGWRNLHAYLAKFIAEDVLDKAGLIKYSDKDNGQERSVYDRFRNRIMFPMFDSSGRVIAFSGRLLGKEEAGSPKYLNSPDSLLFNKSETLYGFHKAKDGIRKWKYAVLVEGQMDLLMCHAHGFDNAIATSGTSLTDLHAKMIKRLTDKLMVIYDADKAGINATLRAWSIALKNNLDVKVAVLPKDEDPASVIQKDKKIFVEALKKAVHVIDYYLNVVVEGHNGEADKRALRKEVVAKVLPLVKAIESAVDRSHFISKIALATQIAEKDLEEDLSRASDILDQKNDNNFIQSDTTASNSGPKSQLDRIIERIAGLTTIIYKGNVEEAKQSLDTLFKHQPTADQAIEELHSSIAQVREGIFNRIVKIVELPPPDVLFEAEILYAGSTRMSEELDILITDLEEITLKELFTKVMIELQKVEREGNKEKAKELLMICKEITLQLSKISQSKFKEKEAKEGK